MKRICPLFLALLLLIPAAAFASAEGTYSAVTLEYAGMSLDAKNTYEDFTVTPDGSTVTVTLQGETLPGTWEEKDGTFTMTLAMGAMVMGGTVDESVMRIENMLGTGMTVVLEKEEAESSSPQDAAEKLLSMLKNPAGAAATATPAPAATATPAPVVTAAPVVTPAPTPAPTAVPAKKLAWDAVKDASGYKVYACSGTGRDAGKTLLQELPAGTTSFASDDTFACVEVSLKNGGYVQMLFKDGKMTETWTYRSDGKIASGENLVKNESYTYNYDGGAFKNRTVTRYGLEDTDFFSWDSERSKIGSSTSSTLSPAEPIRSCTSIEFTLKITEVKSGSPWGLWRLYGRDANTGKWREYGTFKVNKDEDVHETVSLSRVPDIDKLAFLGPSKKYSVSYNISVLGYSAQDSVY